MIIVDLFYNYYDLDDGFEKYIHMLQNIESYHEESNKVYYLLVSLFSFFILNKVLHLKIVTNQENIYEPDYWGND